MMQDYSTPGHMAVAIDQSMVLEVGPTKEMEERYQGITVLDGRGKLVMPGLTDIPMYASSCLGAGFPMSSP